MRCEVMSNAVLAVEDGRPEKFVGYENGFEVGDTLTFRYTARGAWVPEERFGEQYASIHLELIDEVRDRRVMVGAIYDVVNFNGLLKPRSSEAFDYTFNAFAPDFIRLTNGYGGEVRFSRYYKSDWQGIGIIKSPMHQTDPVQTFTLDCRSSSDRTTDIVDAFTLK